MRIQFLVLSFILTSLGIAFFSGCIEVTEKSLNAANCKIASFESAPSPDKEVGIGEYSNGGSSVAQPFVVTNGIDSTTKTASPASAIVMLVRKGEFKANMHTLSATIEGNGTLGPDSKPLVVSDTIDVASISVTGALPSTFKFRTKPALKEATIYWLRIKASYPLSQTNYIAWQSYEGKNGGYFYGDTGLNAMYEQNDPNHFATSLIGIYRFMLFRMPC